MHSSFRTTLTADEIHDRTGLYPAMTREYFDGRWFHFFRNRTVEQVRAALEPTGFYEPTDLTEEKRNLAAVHQD